MAIGVRLCERSDSLPTDASCFGPLFEGESSDEEEDELDTDRDQSESMDDDDSEGDGDDQWEKQGGLHGEEGGSRLQVHTHGEIDILAGTGKRRDYDDLKTGVQ